jgi:hypothetical protein
MPELKEPLSFRNFALAAALITAFVLSGCGGTTQQSSRAVLSPSDQSLSFGSVTVGTATSQLITLTNTGDANLKISSVSVSGQGYSVSGGSNVTLAPSHAVTISVNFGPATSGLADGTLAIKSNASNPLLALSVSGVGVTSQVSSHTVNLSWTPASSVVGYFIYRSTVSGGPYTKLNAVADLQAAFVDSGLASGTYFYVVTSVNAGGVESGYSNEVEAVVP